jgi:cell division protein FtsA
MFNLPVRRGLPINLKGLPEELMKPMYTTAAGLMLHAGNGRGYQNGLARHGRFGRIRTRVTDWVRDFF